MFLDFGSLALFGLELHGLLNLHLIEIPGLGTFGFFGLGLLGFGLLVLQYRGFLCHLRLLGLRFLGLPDLGILDHLGPGFIAFLRLGLIGLGLHGLGLASVSNTVWVLGSLVLNVLVYGVLASIV